MLEEGLFRPNIVACLDDLGGVLGPDQSAEPAAQDVHNCCVLDFGELACVSEVIAGVLFIAPARIGLIAVFCRRFVPLLLRDFSLLRFDLTATSETYVTDYRFKDFSGVPQKQHL